MTASRKACCLLISASAGIWTAGSIGRALLSFSLLAGIVIPAPAMAETDRQRLLQIEDLLFDCGSVRTEALLIQQEKAAHRTVAAICNGRPDCVIATDPLLAPDAIVADCSAITIVSQCADAGDMQGLSATSMESVFKVMPGAELALSCQQPAVLE